jgi:deoxycytidylate deaminase
MQNFNVLTNIAEQASKSELLQKHGSMLLHSSNKITYFRGNNHYLTKSRDGSNDIPSIHAECDVLKKFINHYRKRNKNDATIRRMLKKINLFVIRLNNNKRSSEMLTTILNKYNNNGKKNDNVNNITEYCLDFRCIFGNSFPCINCLNTIKNYGVKKIIVSNEEGICECKKGKYNR